MLDSHSYREPIISIIISTMFMFIHDIRLKEQIKGKIYLLLMITLMAANIPSGVNFLADVRQLAREGKPLSSILNAVADFEIKPFTINSVEDILAAMDSCDYIEIDNDLNKFWQIRGHDGVTVANLLRIYLNLTTKTNVIFIPPRPLGQRSDGLESRIWSDEAKHYYKDKLEFLKKGTFLGMEWNDDVCFSKIQASHANLQFYYGLSHRGGNHSPKSHPFVIFEIYKSQHKYTKIDTNPYKSTQIQIQILEKRH
uniref:Uncharacterized protein n=1 Tax=Strigamia maritima TaxID=126957 RepID=T1J8T4_STRMM